MIEIYFGVPGCGKTTILAQLAEKNKYKYDYIFSNAEIYNTRRLSSADLSSLGNTTLPEHSLLLIDEAGIEFNNRKYKTFSQNLIYYFKMHRHYKVDIILFTQALDTDITIRRLANRYYHVKKIGPFSMSRRIRPICHIEEENHQIIDGYEFYPFFWSILTFQKPFNLCYRPKYYKHFDSWSRENLPIIKGK